MTVLITVHEKRKVDVDITNRELEKYQLDFEKLRLSSTSTRQLLSDVLGVLDRIGLRSHGDTALVECGGAPDGCRLSVTLARETYRFAGAADVDAAVRAGLGDILSGSLVSDGEGYLLAVDVPVERQGLLLEFCRRSGESGVCSLGE